MAMIDWLRRDASQRAPTPEPPPQILLAGRRVPIALRRHATAQRMTMRVAPDGSEVRITLPRWGRLADALDFAESRRGWLEGQIARSESAKVSPTLGGTLLYRGRELAIEWLARAPRRPALIDGAIRLGGPQDNLAPRLQRWLEQEASALIADDLADYCAAAGQPVPELRLSRAQRRWGSCAAGGTIRINWRLVQAPDAIRRSVVAHEVAHLVHFDHSADFHALLGHIFEADVRQANRWLKEHGRSLYGAFG